MLVNHITYNLVLTYLIKVLTYLVYKQLVSNNATTLAVYEVTGEAHKKLF